MPAPRLARFAVVAVIGATVMFTASCASNAEPEPEPSASPPAVDTGAAPTPVATTVPDAPAEEPATEPVTCENLISADTVTELESERWTHQEESFVIGTVAPADGIRCMWGDASVGTGVIFGWAPLTADEAAAAQALLEDDGWIREGGDGTVYYTEDPMQALTVDENGYGMTYEFGDDWVTLSDTKQGLLLIERPGA